MGNVYLFKEEKVRFKNKMFRIETLDFSSN